MNRSKGFTLIELLVVIAIIALLVGLLLPALAKAQRNAKTMKDAAQIKEIHQAFLNFATEHDGKLPIPGLINRNADPFLGQIPGSGPENFRENTTAALYSSMIALEFFNTEICKGPTEVNPVVAVDDDYDYDAYNPGSDSYWDREFKAQIYGTVETGHQCNTSYSHMALCGDRKSVKWRDSQAPGDPMVGTRGVENGVGPGQEDYDCSPTLLLHGGRRQWNGNVCFNDNHVESLSHFYPQLTTFEPANSAQGPQKDNIFRAGDPLWPEHPNGLEADADAWMVICSSALSNGHGVSERFDRPECP